MAPKGMKISIGEGEKRHVWRHRQYQSVAYQKAKSMAYLKSGSEESA